MVVDHRPELDLLDLDHFLFLAGFGRLLLRLVLVLPVIEKLADGRGRIRGDLDQIEPGLLGLGQCDLDVGRAVIVAGLIDQLDFGNSDLLVDARAVLLDGLRGLSSGDEWLGSPRVVATGPPTRTGKRSG